MKVGRIEVGPDGELNIESEEPRRGAWRRRKLPAYWSADQIRESVRACYIGHKDGSQRAAVVVHTPERWYPRKVVRRSRREFGDWHDYGFWGFWWDKQSWANVLMGDEPIDLVAGYESFDMEG